MSEIKSSVNPTAGTASAARATTGHDAAAADRATSHAASAAAGSTSAARLQRAFSRGKAFIPFITAGDPTLDVTAELVLGMAAAGADLIELGIPFSDPIAEGPVIQAADDRALRAGATTDKIFDLVQRLRLTCDVPLAFMTYINPIFTYGCDRFLRRCRETGVDALIVPDLPYEEREELLPFCRQNGVALIAMVAPTSQARIRMIARAAEGFIYCVSSMGVTGERQELGDAAADMVRLVREVTSVPCAIGFGISTPEQAARMAAVADGAIVGSAIVRLVAEHGEACVPVIVDYVRRMKEAVSQA